MEVKGRESLRGDFSEEKRGKITEFQDIWQQAKAEKARKVTALVTPVKVSCRGSLGRNYTETESNTPGTPGAAQRQLFQGGTSVSNEASVIREVRIGAGRKGVGSASVKLQPTWALRISRKLV